jgi:hypothetical protein
MLIGGIEVLYAPGNEICQEDPDENLAVSIEVICNPEAIIPMNMKVLGQEERNDPCTKFI